MSPVLVSVLQGVCMLFLPRIGLTLFIVFYTFGNICALCRSVSPTMTTNQIQAAEDGNCDGFISRRDCVI